MKFLIKLILVLVIIFVVIPFIAYKYIFSGAPRDLGVKYTEADRAAAYTNNGVEGIAITPASDNPGGIKYEGK